eukprot:symbB.v1.2.033500.t1/scaffold4167.1/size45294/3
MVMALQNDHVNTADADIFDREHLLVPQLKNTFLHFDLEHEPEPCLSRTKSCPDLTPAYCASADGVCHHRFKGDACPARKGRSCRQSLCMWFKKGTCSRNASCGFCHVLPRDDNSRFGG